MEEKIIQHWRECVQLWNSAERATKQTELINRQVLEPCINELRYAGRWLILAMSAIIEGRDQIDDVTTIENAFSYAKLCCMQATHDAVDSIVVFLHERIDGISERYGDRIIAMFIQDYHAFRGMVEEIDSVIVLSREKRENRHEFYADILENHIPAVQTFFRSVVAAEAAMNQELEREQQQIEAEERRHAELVTSLTEARDTARSEARTNRRCFWASFIVNIILAGISIVLGIIALR